MATAIDEPADEARPSRGRRRRSRERTAREAVEAAQKALAEATAPVVRPTVAEVLTTEPPATPEPPPEAPEAPAPRKPRRRRTAVALTEAPAEVIATNGHQPAAELEAEAEPGQAVLLPTTVPGPEDEFTDLLGQAVGLRLEAVSREFGGGNERRVSALRDVTLDIGPCEFVSIVGPSGCGKTTLLSLLGGLDRPTTGHVYAAGLPLGELSEADLADYRLQRVSTIFQTFNLIPSMSAEENVGLPMTLAGVEPEERKRRARHLLKLVGLEDRADQRAGRLSGGEQQKVAVARALANRPGLILADEPTGSLDSAAGEVVLKLLEDLNQRGATVVLVTHDPEVARRAKRVVRMIDGRAIELDSGLKTVRNQDPVTPPARLHVRDTVRVGLGSTSRRPLRTTLTTTGVAIGIAAMSLIVALAGGLQAALASPELARSEVHQVAVYPAGDTGAGVFSTSTLSTLSSLDHVRAAWGQVALTGTYSLPSAPGAPTNAPPAPSTVGALVSLPPRAQISPNLAAYAGRLPASDTAKEIAITNRTALALGFPSATAAIGQTLNFDASAGSLQLAGAPLNTIKSHIVMQVTVVGAISNQLLPGGVGGGLVGYGLADSHWNSLAKVNSWKGGEFASITLLADSGSSVDALRDRVESLGFQAQSFGDQFRTFEDLLARLRLALLGLAVVALLLACLGIANTMYTAVLERTKEIAVLKALGARSRDVLVIFVAEAALIGVAGGLLGLIVAVSLARLGNSAVSHLAQGLAGAGLDVFRTDVWIALAALVLAIVLSTVSGLLPALRAAGQDPARALHYE